MSKKKRPETASEEEHRKSRKEVLIAKKEAEQTRGIRIALSIVGGLILVIILIAVVNELFISPNREVATVEAEKITLKDFQDRVEYERAQRIILLESQLEAFNNDVGIIQQYAGQMIVDLIPSSSDTFGETVLNQMVDETLIAQAAAERNIEVSDADVDDAIGADFGYYGGGLPTPLPQATVAVDPTASLTPIPTAVITEVVPVATSMPDPTDGPTVTPFPTATPVSEEAFQEDFAEFFKGYQDFGIPESRYRETVRLGLLRDLVMEALAEEQELPTQGEHANFFVIATTDEAEADEVAASIAADEFLPVWNEIRSRPFDPESTSTVVAAELLQRTAADLTETFGQEVADAAFDADIEVPTAVITAVGQDGTEQYFIIMVSGREVLDLAEATLQAQKEEALATYLEEMKESGAIITDFWRGRVPTVPVLDAKFLAAPTPAPEAVQPEATAETP